MNPSRMLILAGTLLAVAIVASLCVGAVPISLMRIIESVFGGGAESAAGLDSTEETILLQLRLPRIATACLVGAALGIAGAGFQGLFRNPLAEPFVIGASSGAALGATLTIVFGTHYALGWLTDSMMPASAFAAMLGSVVVVATVFGIGSSGGQTSPLTLLLAGVAISSMANAIVSLMMFWNDDKVIVILTWLMGSLADNSWQVVQCTAILTILASMVLIGMSRQLDAFALGDVASQSLGLNLSAFRFWVVVGCSLATAAAVSASGIIGFVGLIAPHISRRLIGTQHVRLLPMSGVVGAIILLVADDIARTIFAPTELPVGIVTALLGCPFFLYLLQSRAVARDAAK